jgi:hypothetical protein
MYKHVERKIIYFFLFTLFYLDLDAGGGSQPVSRIPGMDSTGISVTPSLTINFNGQFYSGNIMYTA